MPKRLSQSSVSRRRRKDRVRRLLEEGRELRVVLERIDVGEIGNIITPQKTQSGSSQGSEHRRRKPLTPKAAKRAAADRVRARLSQQTRRQETEEGGGERRAEIRDVIGRVEPLDMRSVVRVVEEEERVVEPKQVAKDDVGGILSPPSPLPEREVVTPAPVPPRRRHAVVSRKVTWKVGTNTGAAVLENMCSAPYSCGTMREVCRLCGAKFFDKEPKNRQGIRLFCCKNGDVYLPPLNGPVEIQELLTGGGPATSSLLSHVRAVNSLFAMASFKTSTPARQIEGQGHWSFNICGQIYHFTVGMPDSQDLARPRLSHYYFLDVDEVLEQRCEFLEGRVGREVVEKRSYGGKIGTLGLSERWGRC